MAITLPQEQETLSVKSSPSTRVKMDSAPKLNDSFLGKLAENLEREERAQIGSKSSEAKTASKRAENELRRYRVDSEAAIAVTEGGNTVKAFNDEIKSFDDKANKYIQSLPEAFQGEARLQYDTQRTRLYEMGVPKTLKEVKGLQVQTMDDNLKGRIDDAIFMSTDTDKFGREGLPSIFQAAVDSAKSKYGENMNATIGGVKISEIIQNDVDRVMSNSVYLAIKNQASYGAVKDANKLAADYGKLLNPEDMRKVSLELDKAQKENNTTMALEISNRARQMHPDNLVAQEKFINDNATSGDVYKESLEIARTNFRVARAQEELVRSKKVAESYDMADNLIDSGGAIDSNFLRRVPQKDRSALLSYISKRKSGTAITTDDKLYMSLHNMYKNQPDKFANYVLRQHKDRLSQEDLRRLESSQRNIIESNRSEESRIDRMTERRLSDIVELFARDNGIDDETNLAKLYQFSREFLEGFQKQSGKTELEMRNEFKKLLYEKGAIRTKRFFGLFSDRVEAAESINVDLTPAKGDIKAHPSWYDAFQANQKRRGKNYMTRQQMELAIEKLKQQGVNVEAPYQGKK